MTLQNGERQWAHVTVDTMRPRIAALPAADRLDFATGQVPIEMFARMERGEDESAALEAVLNANEETNAIMEQTRHERPELLSSLPAQQVMCELLAAEDDETEKMVALQHARKHEPRLLFPVLRPRNFAETNRRSTLAHLAEQGHAGVDVHLPTPVGGDLGAGFRFEIVADSGASRSALNDEKDDKEANEICIRTALLNLRAASVAPLDALDAAGGYVADCYDDYAASRLLLPALFDNVSVSGERLIFAPLVNTLWVAGSENPEGLIEVFDAIEEKLSDAEISQSPYAWRELLTGRPFVFRDDGLQLFTPPDDHPCADRFHKLDRDVEAMRKASEARFSERTVHAE